MSLPGLGHLCWRAPAAARHLWHDIYCMLFMAWHSFFHSVGTEISEVTTPPAAAAAVPTALVGAAPPQPAGRPRLCP